MPSSEENKRVLTEVIKRQMAILGPDITMAKVKNVPGIEIDAAGNVTNVTGDTQTVLQNLINQFVELSGLIVKKTMESVIMGSAGGAQIAAAQMGAANQYNPVQAQSQQDISPQTPDGYNIGVQPPQPQQSPNSAAGQNNSTDQPPQNPDLVEANRDIEDLNKMLNNLNWSGNGQQ